MESNILIFVFHIFLFFQLRPSSAQDLVRAGYYQCSENHTDVSDINSSLFTHLISGFAAINSTTYQLSLLSSEKCFSIFTDTVKQKNPSVITLLSIGNENANYSIFVSMVSNSFYRKSFIDSSIQVARLYGFQGLDLFGLYPNTVSHMSSMGILFEEWRDAIQLEAKNSSRSELIFTTGVYYSTSIPSGSTYPVDSIRQYLDWVHVVASEYSIPGKYQYTGVNAALYDPAGVKNTNYGIREWINAGLSANKLVLLLPFYGYEWTLVNSKDNSIGAPAAGPANKTTNGHLTYKMIKDEIERHGPNVQVIYNETYVVNYFTIGTSWINFDDVEAIRAKVSYAKEKGLLGYVAWQVSYDDNCVLSEAAASEAHINNSSAQEDNRKSQNKRIFLVILLPTTAAVILLLGIILIFYCWRRKLILNGNGYVSPEYVRKGTYSTKSDVYSFGVLLLQIISGKRISLLCGLNESLSLPDYVS
ncbi:hypothetical protein Pint_14748 [Pistacia integerrima]|uniref:Uncharacterized protein n=1 Tax=Pistacia integerrima TaxID=434235 RepID=A0ACC0Y930_9ROSI|nr:hypothetical protein Pint_14748 [Pistacia integerrima]